MTERERQPGDICLHANVLWLNKEKPLIAATVSRTVFMPASPCPGSKLSFEVLSTNWEEMETLSSKKCWAALNSRYETEEEQCDLLCDPQWCRTPDAGERAGAGKLLGLSGGKAITSWATVCPQRQSHHLLRASLETDAGISTSSFVHLCLMLLLQSLLPWAVVLSFPSFQDGRD